MFFKNGFVYFGGIFSVFVMNIVTNLQGFEPLEEPRFIRRLHHVGRTLHLGHQLLEVRVDPVEAL